MFSLDRIPYSAPYAEIIEARLDGFLLDVSQIDDGYEDDFGEF